MRDRALRGPERHRMLSTTQADRRYRSTGFVGTWPPGIHWTLGEERTIPAHYPGADTEPPVGLELVEAASTQEG